MIVEQSNLYAMEVMSDEKYEKWDPISIEDMEAYFGFNILMGINSLPSLEDYWKKDPLFRYTPVADRISRDRYTEISRYLHFVDNSTVLSRTSPPWQDPSYTQPPSITIFSCIYSGPGSCYR